MKILFDTTAIKERCSGCKEYCPHYMGRTDDGNHAFKCMNCGRLTLWSGGDKEVVKTPGNPPAGV